MLIPIGPVKNRPVTLVRATQDPPIMLDGQVIYFDGRSYQVTLDADADNFDEAEQILLDFGEGATGRYRTRVKAMSPAVVQLEIVGHARRADRREFPRIEGRFELEFAILEPELRHKLHLWLEHPHLTDASVKWYIPHPVMEFSATGLKFNSSVLLREGQILQVRFVIPEVGSTLHTCGAEVVRVDASDDDTYEQAVSFIELDSSTVEALMVYTRLCQDILLGIYPQL